MRPVLNRAKNKYKHDGILPLIRSMPGYLFRNVIQVLPEKLTRKFTGSKLRKREELHEYWRSRSDSDVNAPNHYLDAEPRSEFLLDIIFLYAEQDTTILEPGCNVGRNLNILYENGYTNLTGIEINSEAVKILEDEFPGLASVAEIEQGEIEKIITEYNENEFDLCFTMAVLEHIHPESEFVFEEIARVTSSYLITIEDEGTVTPRHVPRNYEEIFTGFDFELIQTIPSTDFPNDVELGGSFVARVFEKQ